MNTRTLSILATVLVTVAAAACTDDAELVDCATGVQLCGNEGLIRAHVEVERCASDGDCSTSPLSGQREPYIEMIRLDGPVEERCGPGDCGAVPAALGQGWNPGRWKMVAPKLKGLRPPPPVIVDLDAGETVDVTLTYREVS